MPIRFRFKFDGFAASQLSPFCKIKRTIPGTTKYTKHTKSGDSVRSPYSRGYEFCQRGALEHSGRSCRTDGSDVTLRTSWSANQQVGFREMLEKHARSHSPFLR